MKKEGHQFLFEVFDILYNQNPDIHLVIAGDGKKKDKDYVRNLKKTMNCFANIHLLNYIENGKLLIKQADVMLVASQEWVFWLDCH